MSTLEAIGLTLLPYSGAFLGSFLGSTENQIKTWYKKLDKPKWQPPNWVSFLMKYKLE
jgi:tryptophan-rich sensory protein